MIRPLYSKRKVYLIEEADKMTVQAQNCLLKTLEEPPRYAVIILTVSNEDMLLETIRSRVTKYSFRKNTPEEVRQIVESRLSKPIDNMDFIISYSGGIIGTALELVESKEFVQLRQRVIEIIDILTKTKLLNVFEVYDFFDENKNDVDMIFDIMILFYRDLLVSTKHWKENILINSDKKDIIFNNISKYSTSKLVKNIEVIEMTRKNLKYNANFQLAIEMMLMKLQEEKI
jgi:DNA polymerase-3 subunit delta'